MLFVDGDSPSRLQEPAYRLRRGGLAQDHRPTITSWPTLRPWSSKCCNYDQPMSGAAAKEITWMFCAIGAEPSRQAFFYGLTTQDTTQVQ